LITLGCEIGHANASTDLSTCLSFFVATLDFFPAKSTMVGVFIILDMQTLQISSYPPSLLNPDSLITLTSSGTHITPLFICYCMTTFKACVCHGIGLILLLENLATKSWTFYNLPQKCTSLGFHSPPFGLLYTYSKEWMMFNVLEMICWSNHLPYSQKSWL
jgi:hypothetical protein